MAQCEARQSGTLGTSVCSASYEEAGGIVDSTRDQPADQHDEQRSDDRPPSTGKHERRKYKIVLTLFAISDIAILGIPSLGMVLKGLTINELIG
jgi:hypothetical protein